MENLIVSVNCVIPMFLTLFTGFLVRRSKVVPPEMFNQLSTLSFRALLPCHMFYNIYSTDLGVALQPKLLCYLAVWLAVWYVLSYGVSTAIVPDPRRRGACIQNAYRSNIAVIGASLAASMMGAEGVAMMAMVIGVIVPAYNVLAVFTLESCRGEKMNLKKTLGGVIRNPLIIGCALGLVCLVCGIKLPGAVEKAVSSIGSAGSVTTLLALGASFQFDGLRRNLHTVIRCCSVRLVLAPLTAVAGALLLGFRGNPLGVILICTAAPTASTAYPMALAADSDYELTGQLVVCTSLFCNLTVFLWIFCLKQLAVL